MLLECLDPTSILRWQDMKAGQYIRERRVLKGWTQEDLATKTGITARTIQRIETGEVEPRAYSLRSIAAALEIEYQELIDCDKIDLQSVDTSKEKFWLPLLHLSGLFILFLPPLLIWYWKKNDMKEVNRHGIDVLNFQLNMLMFLFPLGILAVLLITIPFIVLIAIYSSVIIVVNALRVANNQPYKYPIVFRILKP